jgi:hypothetical protein
VLRVFSLVSNGQRAGTGDVDALWAWADRHLDPGDPRFYPEEGLVYCDVGIQRDFIVFVVDALISIADFTPRLEWPEGADQPSVVMHKESGELWHPATGWLFPALVTRLCASLSSPLGVYRCDECGAPFGPSRRRPRGDRRRFCPTCSADASLAAKRAWWRENRSPRRMLAPAGSDV